MPHSKLSRFAFASLLLLAFPSAVFAQEQPTAVTTDVVEPIDQSKGFTSNEAVIASLTIFVLAIFVGNEVITKVPPTLHTPLMSGSNAISGITLVGALVVAGNQESGVAVWLGVLAIAFATINVIGGFLVTHRMLSMFKRK